MTLPASGQLGFSNIADELGLSTDNLSMRSMASKWALGTPDSLTEFYSKSYANIKYSYVSGDFYVYYNDGTYYEGWYPVTKSGHVSPYIVTLDFNYEIYADYIPDGRISLYYSKVGTDTWTEIDTVYNEDFSKGQFSITGIDYNDPIYIRIYIEYAAHWYVWGNSGTITSGGFGRVTNNGYGSGDVF